MNELVAKPEPADVIAAGRAEIDEIDKQIIELVQRRVTVSRTIQEARLAAGGRRVELARENQIITRYREGLGKPGTSIALTLLELCRGQR
ncbi:chorismate mutase [Carbonactinospora thermoautotrophica]|uniref:Chorismate mutase n=1 Tax=Carbonactinospora thermoautotrophica TaxID=1469144 RepID=A0A132MXM4_9ACTN|nr:chorismate mutase [Carbonactinospora thermoautotrophica]KWX02599.1 Chorismate mutase I [Carbonactinospora thermoautotrophica]KWX03674.1 chorismate mutase [Carbonactinospora thermoautotrophica]KWX08970.1 chorismate mutase [Carbonactinospora thermoautotrophica]